MWWTCKSHDLWIKVIIWSRWNYGNNYTKRFRATIWIKGLQDGCLENWETTTGRGRKCKHKGLKFLYLINKNNKIQNMNYHIINKTLFLGRGNATEKIQNISPSLTICIKCESKKWTTSMTKSSSSINIFCNIKRKVKRNSFTLKKKEYFFHPSTWRVQRTTKDIIVIYWKLKNQFEYFFNPLKICIITCSKV